MSEHDAEMYTKIVSKVRNQIQALRIMLLSTEVCVMIYVATLWALCCPKLLLPYWYTIMYISRKLYCLFSRNAYQSWNLKYPSGLMCMHELQLKDFQAKPVSKKRKYCKKL